ncbi:hypothetical protein NMY22_g12098 [Coprinellus aureogranulatus]|nr:hypothetical protein NMY22_g12098 [Coprinellus aureogranulatus]
MALLMIRFPLLLLTLGALSTAHDASAPLATVSSSLGGCKEAVITVAITANNTVLNLNPPEDQQVLTDFVVQLTSAGSNVIEEITGGTFVNRATCKVYTLLCVPNTQDDLKTVELAIHGGGFDHTYWTLGGPGSKYNYVEAALKAGHAVFAYDRLGTGKSDKPDGIKEAQTPTHIEIAAELVKYLKGSPDGHSFGHFVGIGHSYGSVTLVGLANKYGNLLDATVVTGFTSHKESLLPSFATWTLTIAALDNPERFGSLPPGYIIWNNIINNQQNFFKFPNYDPDVLQTTEDTKWPAALGELLGLDASPSSLYTNPVLVVTGENDYIACGGNCYQEVNGMNLVEATKEVFPSVTDFDTYIPPKTGHGLNAHFSASETCGHIQNWISGLA